MFFKENKVIKKGGGVGSPLAFTILLSLQLKPSMHSIDMELNLSFLLSHAGTFFSLDVLVGLRWPSGDTII